MKLEARERALLALVEEYRDQECRKLLDDARRRADALVRGAYARHRTALHERVIAERTRAESLIQAARAEQATRERRRSEGIDGAMMDAAWPLLHAALAARWADPTSRRGWVGSVLAQASRRLPSGIWSVRHPPDWAEAERRAFADAVQASAGAAPRLIADAEISAGLCVATADAALDATLAGLLRDRERVRARLLALWHGYRDGVEGGSETGDKR